MLRLFTKLVSRGMIVDVWRDWSNWSREDLIVLFAIMEMFWHSVTMDQYLENIIYEGFLKDQRQHQGTFSLLNEMFKRIMYHLKIEAGSKKERNKHFKGKTLQTRN